MGCPVADIINHAKFQLDRFMGFRAPDGRKSLSPIDLRHHPYNSYALPCYTVIPRASFGGNPGNVFLPPIFCGHFGLSLVHSSICSSVDELLSLMSDGGNGADAATFAFSNNDCSNVYVSSSASDSTYCTYYRTFH